MQGVGKVVSYTNADRILPRELLDAIQQYADGVYLYIPRKAERKRAWGEATDSRRDWTAFRYRSIRLPKFAKRRVFCLPSRLLSFSASSSKMESSCS